MYSRVAISMAVTVGHEKLFCDEKVGWYDIGSYWQCMTQTGVQVDFGAKGSTSVFWIMLTYLFTAGQ